MTSKSAWKDLEKNILTSYRPLDIIRVNRIIFILHHHEFEKIHPVYILFPCSPKIYRSYFLRSESRDEYESWITSSREREREREIDRKLNLMDFRGREGFRKNSRRRKSWAIVTQDKLS